MNTVYLALGTNLGDRLANIEAVLAALPPQVLLVQRSPIYQTAPWGYPDQPDYLNLVVKGETELSPEKLLAYLKQIEVELGRRPTIRYGPRLIDIDILFYDDLVVVTPDLIIPHPSLHERPFVLVPLADLDPDLVHPFMCKTVQELLEEAGREGVIAYAA